MNKQIFVLIVEDSEDDAELIFRQFKQHSIDIVSKRVETGDQMRAALQERSWDLVLSDYNLPEFDAASALTTLQSFSLDIPFIVVSGMVTEGTAVDLMKAGAHDYVMKNNLQRLIPAVERELNEAQTRREKKQAERELRESEERYRTAIEHSNDGVGLVKDGRHIYVNRKFMEIFGYDNLDDIIGKPTTIVVHPDYLGEQKDFSRRRREGKEAPARFEFVGIRKNGTEVLIEASVTKTVYEGEQVLFIFTRDITERKKAERRREFSNRILEVLNDPGDAANLIRPILYLLKEYTLVDAIGLRIKKGFDYPYAETVGFPKPFNESEWHLCVRDENNNVVCDPENNNEPYLDCICGKIIQGQVDSLRPFVTQKGSFWTNNMPRLFASANKGERAQSVRQNCVDAGFESVALIPLESGGRMVGLLHLNHRRPDYFTLETIESLERIAASVSIALLRRQAEEELINTTDKLRKSLVGTLQAMSHTVEIKDPYTAGHQKRVSMIAHMIAQELNLPCEIIDNIRMAGAIHDIGKISVPSEILSKPTRLSDIEMAIIRTHSRTGYDILKETGLPPVISRIILEHHERIDGSGYPDALNGEEILLESRILAIADVVEAMAFDRPYRPALGIDIALDEIGKNKGILYDSRAAEACLMMFREGRFDFNKIAEVVL